MSSENGFRQGRVTRNRKILQFQLVINTCLNENLWPLHMFLLDRHMSCNYFIFSQKPNVYTPWKLHKCGNKWIVIYCCLFKLKTWGVLQKRPWYHIPSHSYIYVYVYFSLFHIWGNSQVTKVTSIHQSLKNPIFFRHLGHQIRE